jgi:hypothetical protein
MKVGLIPPIPHLKDFGCGDFHLLLTHLLEDPYYVSHYKNERRHGAYLVLDNSAHELQEGQRAEFLMLNALNLQAQEVVVPDVLFDAEKTIQRCIETHEIWYESNYPGMRQLNPAIMYVPQSANRVDYKSCLDELANLHLYTAKHHNIRKDFVIGVSKDYEDIWDGGVMRVMKESVVPMRNACAKKGIGVQVHLLGWARNLWYLRDVVKKYPWIRSTDSAKPFVYALDKMALYPELTAPEYPTRPPNYFQRKLMTKQKAIAAHNVAAFRGIVDG